MLNDIARVAQTLVSAFESAGSPTTWGDPEENAIAITYDKLQEVSAGFLRRFEESIRSGEVVIVPSDVEALQKELEDLRGRFASLKKNHHDISNALTVAKKELALEQKLRAGVEKTLAEHSTKVSEGLSAINVTLKAVTDSITRR